MRVIAGSLGGRTFVAPKGSRTHPMSDKARGGLFNAIGDISGMTVFDAYAGSGALGFEAISRGASNVLAVENDRQAALVIKKNMQALGLSANYKLVEASNTAWSARNLNDRFDIVLCDPPFDALKQAALLKLSHHVAASGLFVVHFPSALEKPHFGRLTEIAHKTYGDSQLVFYRLVA